MCCCLLFASLFTQDLLNQISFRKHERYVNPIWQLKPTPAWYTDEQTPADTPTPKQP